MHLKGGSADFTVEHITLELVAHVEAEHDGGESEGAVVFHRQVVGGNFRLEEGELRNVPFSFPLPWETPITELYGQGLGIALGVRTELGIAGEKDKGDLDPLSVRPCRSRKRSSKPSASSASASSRPTSNSGTSGGRASSCPSTRRSRSPPRPGTHTRSTRSK
ncbi:sporulation protein [Streptomyces narbonensis]